MLFVVQGIDTNILKIIRTSGAFDCNQCNLAHNSYICLPKILRWRIHGCRHIFGLWKKLYLGLGGRFTFIDWVYVLRSSWDPQMQNPMYRHWQKMKILNWVFYQNFKLHSKVLFFFEIVSARSSLHTYIKTRSFLPNLSKLAPADVSSRTLLSKTVKALFQKRMDFNTN